MLKDKIFKPKEDDALNQESSAIEVVGEATKVVHPPMESEDVETQLIEMEAALPNKRDWRHSIPDLMQIIQMDSSYDARKDLRSRFVASQSDTDRREKL